MPLYPPLALKEQPCPPEKRRVDVALVIDASATVLDPTRAGRSKMDAARDAAGCFLDLLSLPRDQAAIVWFNEQSAVEQGLTGDRAALLAALGRIQNREYTRIDLGVALAREELLGARHKAGNARAMIVLTDGKSNPVGPELAVREAALAKVAGVTVFTVGIGEQEVDGWALAAMASQPGYYYPAADAEDLADIYQQIAVLLPCPPEYFWPARP